MGVEVFMFSSFSNSAYFVSDLLLKEDVDDEVEEDE